MPSLGSTLEALAGAILLKPCRKRPKKKPQTDPVELSLLNRDVDVIVATIDRATEAQESAKETETPSTNSGTFACADDDSAIELVDPRSFDLEAAATYTDFSRKDLGRHHSSMNVRNCNSATCPSCEKEERAVYFVKSKKPTWIWTK